MSSHKEEYPGVRPFSEPEVQIVKRVVEKWHPHVWVNVHSGMEALFMPFDHKVGGDGLDLMSPTMLSYVCLGGGSGRGAKSQRGRLVEKGREGNKAREEEMTRGGEREGELVRGLMRGRVRYRVKRGQRGWYSRERGGGRQRDVKEGGEREKERERDVPLYVSPLLSE
jgi:hypothetical protein